MSTTPSAPHNPTDPNSDNFDPILFINKNLPEFESSKLNRFTDNTLREQIAIQKSVFSTLQNQQSIEENAINSLHSVPDHFSSVRRDLNTLESQTKYTEVVLKDISDGVTLLGLAKKNMTFVVKFLQHIQQLDLFINNCEIALRDNFPNQASDALRSAKMIVERYGDVKDIEIFDNANKRLGRLYKDISNVTKDVIARYEDGAIDKKIMQNYLCLIDELNSTEKQNFISYFVTHLTLGYTNSFPLNSKESGLEHIEKRYIWFLEKMKAGKDTYKDAIPSNWRFWELLVQDFAATSKDTFHELLEKTSKSNEESFTTTLVKAIRTTRAFETEVIKRVTPPQQKPILHEGIISNCFDAYMDFYISKEQENISSFLTRFVNEENFNCEENVLVLSSCKDLLLYFRKCCERCSALTIGEPLVQLCNVVAGATVEYAKAISQKSVVKDNKRCMTRQALTANTLKYVYFRVERLLATTLGNTQKITVGLKDMQDKVVAMVGDVIEQIVAHIMKPAEDIMNELPKANWVIEVGQESEVDYVIRMTEAVGKQMNVIDGYIVNDYYMQICHLITSEFCEQYINTLMKCKRINEIGAQLLLMDYSQCKSFLLKLPNRDRPLVLEGIGDTSVKNNIYDVQDYTTVCAKEYSRAECILKVLQISDKSKAKSTCSYFFPDLGEDFFPRIWSLREKSRDASSLSKIASAFTFSKSKKDYLTKAFSTILN
ncbi:Vps53 N-terminal domain-containing protein [Entamoeba marina]